MAEMIHFIRQTQAYCQVEVIECSWEVLHQFIQQKKGDLDSLIGAHRFYLDRIVKKILLLTHKTGREVSAVTFSTTFLRPCPGEFAQSNERVIHNHPTVPRIYRWFHLIFCRPPSDRFEYRTTFTIIACRNLPARMLSVTSTG